MLEELLGALRHDDPEASLHVSATGRASLAFRPRRAEAHVVLRTTERELTAACRALAGPLSGPGVSEEQAGLRLLLVHLDEVLETRDTEQGLRIDAAGLVWPDR